MESTHSCLEHRSTVVVLSEQSIQMILDPSRVEPQLSQEIMLEEKNVHNGEYCQTIGGFRNSNLREPDGFGKADIQGGSIKSHFFLTETEDERLKLQDLVPGHRPFY